MAKTFAGARISLLFALVFAGLSWSAPAQATSGIYLQFGLGYGDFTGNELITQEVAGAGDIPDTTPGTCCPGAGLAGQFRLGYSLFGFGGPEFGLVGEGWDLSGDSGGAGFIGGGIRLFPLKFLSLAGLTGDDFPLDLGVGVLIGYSIVGEDFAYTGSFVDVDINLEYKLTSFLSAGVKLDIIFPSYSDFAFTDYKNSRGRCLDDGGNQITTPQVVNGNAAGGVTTKDNAACNGRGPRTRFISPQVVFTFHFDILGI